MKRRKRFAEELYPRFISKGTYSSVYQVSAQIACKVIVYHRDLSGAINEYRSEHVEPCIHFLLANSPFVLDFYTYQHGLLCTEYANLGNVFDYPVQRINDSMFLSFYHQVLAGLEWICSRYPTFSHNDLSTANVLLTGSITQPVAKLADFDLACIPGLFDNYKVAEWRLTIPSYNFGVISGGRADAYKFTNYLYQKCYRLLSPELIRQIAVTFPDFVGDVNVCQPTHQLLMQLPSLTEMSVFSPAKTYQMRPWPIVKRTRRKYGRFKTVCFQCIPGLHPTIVKELLSSMEGDDWADQVWSFCEAVRTHPKIDAGTRLFTPEEWCEFFGKREDDVDYLLQRMPRLWA